MFKFNFLNNRMITVSIMLITLFALVTLLKYFKLYEGLNTKMHEDDDDDDDDDEEYSNYSKYRNKETPSPKINLNFYTQDASKQKRRKYKSTPAATVRASISNNVKPADINPNLIVTNH